MPDRPPIPPMTEKVMLAMARDATDKLGGHGGRGLSVDNYLWASPEWKALLDAALVNRHIEIVQLSGPRGLITDLGRQRLRALGGFDGTPEETIRYEPDPDATR